MTYHEGFFFIAALNTVVFIIIIIIMPKDEMDCNVLFYRLAQVHLTSIAWFS